jgi:hypothetical protein
MNADAAARHSSGLLAIPSVAPPYLWKGASHAPLANRAYWTSQKSISSAHRPCERIEKAGWGVLVTREKKMQFPANRDGRPSPHRGRVVRPDDLGGKACRAYTSTVPVRQSDIRAAHRGLDAPVRAASISSIKFGFVNELNLILSSHRVARSGKVQADEVTFSVSFFKLHFY